MAGGRLGRRIATAALLALALSACSTSAEVTGPSATDAAPLESSRSAAPSAAPSEPPGCAALLPAETLESFTAQGIELNPPLLDDSWYDGPSPRLTDEASTIAEQRLVTTCVLTAPTASDGVTVIELYAELDQAETVRLHEIAERWTVEPLSPTVTMRWDIDADPNTSHREAWVTGDTRWLRVEGNGRESEQVAREIAAKIWALPAVLPPSAGPVTSCETLVPQATIDEHAARGLVLSTTDPGYVPHSAVEAQAVAADHWLVTCLFAPPGSRDRMVVIQVHTGLDASDIAVLERAAADDVALGYAAVPVAGSASEPVIAYVSELRGMTTQTVQVFHDDTWLSFFTHLDVDVMPAVSQIATRLWD
ncbi:hypothetical protein [Agrococcus sp. Marseille-P2731]|uniref:hypothetical protein n=1 Tax=Agrococcus sp. Marseille-P2731 TaxID=1841862 RepID=UPI000931B67D|nr:hypothetical protein [Agrococcus sp. Marseille-P2731]